jgi:[protein-PII] uridylyltransferase
MSFALQRELAAALHYADRPGKSAVERFMHMYFLQARSVGDLTGQFLAQLDEQLGAKGRRFALPTFLRRPRRLGGFVISRGRLALPNDRFLREDPRRLLSLFALAAREKLEIHPSAMRAATRDSRLVEQVRDDPEANAHFLEVLTAREQPELVLRWMNEANVFGRFVPDFRRVVAQMQFDMYHHYTVDEHTIRAVGLLAAIERGELAEDHPLATALFRQIGSRRVLYVAVLLHDIAKGRKGDHSILGEAVARELCPRFGLDAGETDTVAWLVRHHLLLSHTAFKRDLADPKTIDDFVAQVQSPERLRLLLILTVVDIRAVGPGVWTEWKRKLIRTLHDLSEERLRLGHKQRGRAEEIAFRQQQLSDALGWAAGPARAHARRLPDSYWVAEPPDWILDNARQIAAAEAALGPAEPSMRIEAGAEGATRVTVYAPDRPGLFYRISAALAGAGAGIVDARIHTTRDGMALDNLLVHDRQGQPYSDRRRRQRLAKALPPRLPMGRCSASRRGPRRGVRDRAVGDDRGRRVAPLHRGRGAGRRPAGPARRPGQSDLRSAADHPFGAYRHLWRASGGRLLPGGRQWPKAYGRGDRGGQADAVRRRQPPPARRSGRLRSLKTKGPAVARGALPPVTLGCNRLRGGCGRSRRRSAARPGRRRTAGCWSFQRPGSGAGCRCPAGSRRTPPADSPR